MMFPSKILWESVSRASIEVLSVWQTCPYSPLIRNTMALISPRRNDISDEALIEPNEFKLNGSRCVLAKPQKHNKKRTFIVWMYGKDIQLKQDLEKDNHLLRGRRCHLLAHDNLATLMTAQPRPHPVS
jgi:hypothetical protein